MLAWSIAALRAVDAVTQIVVALPQGVSEAPAGTIGAPGGEHRSQSVRAAFAAAAADGDPIIVHDAARPLVTPAIFQAALDGLAAGDWDGAIAAAPVTDTIKRAAGGVVTDTLDRSTLWAVQTPQVFRRAALARALSAQESVLRTATDDAWLVERQGGAVGIVPSPPANFKVTTRADLCAAELALQRTASERA